MLTDLSVDGLELRIAIREGLCKHKSLPVDGTHSFLTAYQAWQYTSCSGLSKAPNTMPCTHSDLSGAHEGEIKGAACSAHKGHRW